MRLVAAIGCALLLSTVLAAQAQTPTGDGTGFEKKNYNYSEWTKGLFSEVVTVTHPGKMIFLAVATTAHVRGGGRDGSGQDHAEHVSAAPPRCHSLLPTDWCAGLSD